MNDQKEKNSEQNPIPLKNDKTMKMSILDQSAIVTGQHPKETLANNIELAQWAEELGYESILFSEHHGVPAYASSSPEILAAIVLGQTKKIKVGTGGIMLRNYPAYKVAEITKLLASVFPGRFVLGLGKAPGGLKMSTLALNDNKLPTISTISQKIKDIVAYLSEDTTITQDRYDDLIAQPQHLDTQPEVWWLGSGNNSAREASKNGLGYSYSHFLVDEKENASVNLYKNEFVPSVISQAPRLQIALSVSVAEDYDTAKRNAYSMAYQILEARRGLAPSPLIHPDEVEQKIQDSEDNDDFQQVMNNILIATPETIGRQLSEITTFYAADNFIVMSNIYDKEARFKNFELLIKNIQ